MYILSLWDGHDSGASLIRDNAILYAANEERFTKRKLEIKFPYNSIRAALSYAGIKPDDVKAITFPTLELTKTMSRVFPRQKEVYYAFRRRKMLKPRLETLMHYYKYTVSSMGVLPLCDTISKNRVSRELNAMGFKDYILYPVDHHLSHATTAAFASGFKKALVITLDGLGDGLSGSVSILNKGKLTREHVITARNSLGIFYEQVTNIVGMRELEDEGKVMAMADYSYPFRFEENRLKEFFRVDGIDIYARYGPVTQYDMLSRIAWSMPREQFAYMAQQLTEHILEEFVANCIAHFGIHDVAMAGGTFSNVKANMELKDLSQLNNWFVFPHMGDGGIALGSGMHINYMLNGVGSYKFENAYLGNDYSEEQIRSELRKEKKIRFERDSDKSGHAADLVNNDNYVFWFQGRMEYGPRALGNRSIIAKAGSEEVKERLNIYVKQREWYQPFAPSMLEEDSRKLLEGIKGDGRFMTMVYAVKPEKKGVMKSVMHVDMTARPQIVGNENRDYRKLLERVRKKSGYGVVLNTSFNIHGMPIVMDPRDAISTMKKTKTRYMFLGDFFVENREA